MSASTRQTRILVTPRSLTEAGLDAVAELDELRQHGFELISGPAGRRPTEDELRLLLPGCVGWLAGVEAVPKAVFASADVLRVISRNGTGVDAIDLDAAERAGVTVVRAAGANAQGVAELALALALACVRGIPWSSSALKQGEWSRLQAREIGDLRVGVVGLGAIGRKVAAMFRALGATVVGTDPFTLDPETESVSLTELLSRSDIVSLHVPPVEGRPLIDSQALDQLPAGAVLINTARSSLVDQEAVLESLESGRLSAYAVDAFDSEPPQLTLLLLHERVLATPHLGAFTGGSVRRATSEAVSNLLAALEDSSS